MNNLPSTSKKKTAEWRARMTTETINDIKKRNALYQKTKYHNIKNNKGLLNILFEIWFLVNQFSLKYFYLQLNQLLQYLILNLNLHQICY
jgi:hypothetical protein